MAKVLPLKIGSVWAARLLILPVFFFNLQCAALFILTPHLYASGFEVQGTAGAAMVRGMGILFVMWNVPYAFALSHPARHRTSLLQAVIMQGIGLVGETLMLALLPSGHPALSATALRFILFDGFGLLLLVTALILMHRLTEVNSAAPLQSRNI